MKIQGRCAIVTGAGNGIGQAVAVELAERGAGAVALVDRNETVIRIARMINDRMDAPIAEAMIGDTTDEAFRRGSSITCAPSTVRRGSACRRPRSTATSSPSSSTSRPARP